VNLIHLAIALGALVTTLGTSVLTGLFGSSARAQAITAAVLSLVLGVADAARQGALDHLDWRNLDTILVAAGVVYAASQVAFHGLWRHTGATWLETLVGPRLAAKVSKDEQLALAIGRAVATALNTAHASALVNATVATPPVEVPPPPA
jgi:hypothetical protein